MINVPVLAETTRDEVGSITLCFTGFVNNSSVSGLLMLLADIFKNCDGVVIDLSGVTEIDVSVLKLFCSCHCSSIFFNKGFRMIGNDRQVIWDAAASAGCQCKSECIINSKHRCLWAVGGTC